MPDRSEADELLTLDDVAGLLKITRAQVLDLTRKRTQERSDHPLPVVKFHAKLLRVRKKDFYDWVERVAKAQRRGTGEIYAATAPKTGRHKFSAADIDPDVINRLSKAFAAQRKSR